MRALTRFAVAAGLLCLAGMVAAAPAHREQATSSAQGRIDNTALTSGAHAALRLRIEQEDDHYAAWAENTLAGPVEVMLHYQGNRNMASQPPLPARALVVANGSTLVANLYRADRGRPGDFELTLEAVPGDPNARPRAFEYLIPLQQQALRVDQGFGGAFSHSGAENRHALDFAAPIGTPVMAARAGTVMQVESDYAQAGLSEEQYGGRANFVRILHDDGTMALYAHLQPDGARVRVGQQVRQGQQIGLSGNTGFSSGPHLHFAVQVNRGMRLESIPIRLRGPQGVLQFAR